MAEKTHPRPTEQVIAEHLRDQICSGALPAGGRLPSESDMIKQYNVSRVTVRGAIRQLINEGLVFIRQGKGAFVRRAPDERGSRTEPRGVYREEGARPEDRERYVDTSRADGMMLVQEPKAYETTAGRLVANDLGIAEGSALHFYERLLTDAANWRQLNRLYLPLATCTGIEALELNPYREPGVLHTILTRAGYRLSLTEHVSARSTLPADAELLRIPQGIPMMVVRRYTTDDRTGRVLALEETRLNANDTKLAYRLTVADR